MIKFKKTRKRCVSKIVQASSNLKRVGTRQPALIKVNLAYKKN